MTKAPKLYYIDHHLTRISELSDEVCASFTDEQIEEYKALFDQYITVQRQAAADGVILAEQLRELVDAMFQDPTVSAVERSKQRKYFDRMIRNGETVVDKHAKRYPRPDVVVNRINRARKRYGDLEDVRVSVGGDDTLQEINNAVTFLMSKGMELNTDFTVSNAVGIAKGIAEDTLQDSVSEEPTSLDGYALMVGGEKQDISNYGLCATTGTYKDDNMTLVPVSFEAGELIVLDNTMEICFQDSATPTIKVKK